MEKGFAPRRFLVIVIVAEEFTEKTKRCFRLKTCCLRVSTEE